MPISYASAVSGATAAPVAPATPAAKPTEPVVPAAAAAPAPASEPAPTAAAASTSASAAANAAAGGDATKPILAERYKTSMCKNWKQKGECPYESRCMFAHGDAELRTKQMNLDDGLVTENAIKAFQREQTSRAERKKKKAAAKAKAKANAAAAAAASAAVNASAAAHDDAEEEDAPAPLSRHNSVSGTAAFGCAGAAAAASPCCMPGSPSAKPACAALAAGAVPAFGLAAVVHGVVPTTSSASSSTVVHAALARCDKARFVSPLAAAMIVGRQCEYEVNTPAAAATRSANIAA